LFLYDRIFRNCFVGRVWDNESDTNALFQQHTVDEIRQIERKTRMDIEKKKEDLRQMVGERYHELIDAADTITSMKNFSGTVSTFGYLVVLFLC
jgi:hypothetical protein